MERNDWHLREAEFALSELKTDMYTGLSSAEAARRKKREGAGRIWYIQRTSVKETVIACLSDLATLLLMVTAIFAAIFEEGRSAALLVGILAVGAVIRTAAYCKARRVLEENAAEGVPTCSVLRDGKMHLLSAEELVPGDIVFLEGGDMVPGDGRIVAGEDMAVSERGITANRDPVRKYETVIHTAERGSEIPAEYRSNLLYAGSTVLWGQARMAVTATGENTLIVRKQGGIRIPAGETLPLLERLNRWCRTSALVMLACVLFITALALFVRRDFTHTFLVSMALAVASMSEYLTTIAYIIIAVAVQDTGRRKKTSAVTTAENPVHGGTQRRAAVISDASSLERLAGVKRLVLSDVRLLKSGEMTLHSWFAGGNLHSFDGFCKEDRTKNSASDPKELLRLLLATVGGQKLHTSLSGGAITAMPEKYTMLHRAADAYTARTGQAIDFSFTALDSVDAKTGISGGLDTVLLQEGGLVWAVISGEIRQVLQCCQTWLDPAGKTVPLDEAMRKKILTEAARLAYIGADVIACAKRPSPYITLNRLSTLQSSMTFLGFCTVAEPPAEGVKEIGKRIREAGLSLVLLSEDMERDLYYGHEIGLFDKNTVLLPMTGDRGLPASGTAIVEMPPVQTHALKSNVNHSKIRYERLKALLTALPKAEEPDSTGPKAKTKNEKTPHTAILVRSVLDARLLTLGDAAVAVGDSDTRPMTQPLKAKADVLVYPGGGHGGLAEAVGSVIQSRRALFHLWGAAVYLSSSQLSRTVLLLCSVLCGFAMPDPEVLLAIGLLLDFAAVLVMAFVRPPKDILSLPEECLGLPGLLPGVHKKRMWVLYLGLLWGLLEGAVPLVCVHLLKTEYMGTLIASVILSQLLLSGAIGQRVPYLQCQFHVAYVLYALLAVGLTAAALLLWPAAWYSYFLALVPPALLLTAWELFKKRRLPLPQVKIFGGKPRFASRT